MKMSPTSLPSFLVLLSMLGGCATIRGDGKGATPGRIVAISLFKCNCDQEIRESVQDTFVDLFFNNTNAKPIKGDNGDLTVVGTITMQEGQSGQSKGSLFGNSGTVGGSATSSFTSGNYVTGLTVQVYKKGELIAAHSVGQDLENKKPLISVVSLAQQEASDMVKVLTRQNEIGYK